MESGGFRYHKRSGEMSGNIREEMILVSVGNKFPADVVVKPRIKNQALAKKSNTNLWLSSIHSTRST